ncbi:MAG: sulfate transporter [Acidiferrobacteraceae bacterium]|nr:sulfate transporter [Acidiferrobacteraceae bacterium]|tara:strand:+ start:3714 stop:4550 length:837 start_codon:yes stop_codon:yes gene_type:complete
MVKATPWSFLWLSVLIFLGFGSVASSTTDRNYILVHSTTSTVGTGLFDAVLPFFTEQTGIEVRVISAGTGQALASARKGDVDVVVVHARQYEEAFVAEGFGLERHDLMYNDFIVVGPRQDPAKVRQSKDIVDVFNRIASHQSFFVSRGDNSGTHIKELSLWEDAAVVHSTRDRESWYLESGAGMGTTLNIATNKYAYTLTDRGSWIRFGDKGDLEVLYEDDEDLLNQYGIILVNPNLHPHTNFSSSKRFLDWLLGSEGQSLIDSYRLEGQQLFFSNAN